jgi:hypothetical protein
MYVLKPTDGIINAEHVGFTNVPFSWSLCNDGPNDPNVPFLVAFSTLGTDTSLSFPFGTETPGFGGI